MTKTFIDWIIYLDKSKETLNRFKNEVKILQFEYIVMQILDWYGKKKNIDTNDLGIVKLQKLLFFIINDDKDLLNIFNEIKVNPSGHYEDFTYQYIKTPNTQFSGMGTKDKDHWYPGSYFNFSNESTIVRFKSLLPHNLYKLQNAVSNEFKDLVNKSIERLQKKNPNIVYLEASELIDISKRYYSFKKYYKLAKDINKLSFPVPLEVILLEDKTYVKDWDYVSLGNLLEINFN